MPKAAPRPCAKAGCNKLTTKGRCEEHQRKHGWDHKESSTKRGYGYKWQKTRVRILRRDNGLCQPCKRKGIMVPATEVDHIVRKAIGGTDDDENLQAICGDCHKEKTARE